MPGKKWAVVTGGSSGIGAAIAAELASRTWNVLLIGRDAQALEEHAARLRKHNVEALTLSADLSTTDGVRSVIRFVDEKQLSVGALVNNAGFGIHAPFARNDSGDVARMVDLQINATLELTRALLPGMLERKSGYILNVASVYAFSPVPDQAVYAACKSFMLSFSRSLAIELNKSGVSVSVLCPGITHTAFRSRAGMKDKKSTFAMSAEEVAGVGVRGMLRGKLVIVPGWGNWLYSSMPAGILGRFTLWFNKRRGIAGEKGNA